MCYRLALMMLLMLLAVLPVMSVLAAPIPAASAVLDIGPPEKGWSVEKHCEWEIDHYLTDPYGHMFTVWLDPEIRGLPSVAAKKDARSWLTRNLRVTKEDRGSRLRLTFRAGDRREQIAILNTLLRAYIKAKKDGQKFFEECLRKEEDTIPELERRIASGQHRESVADYRQGIEELRSVRIPARRAEIERYKQITVIKWAK